MGKTFHAEKAEQEANQIGMKFAHSSDVVKDMSRAYNVDFSSIRVHTDSAADSRVKAAGKDALAQGNNLFFGKGIFESSEPDAKALVAHEFAHTMQQGVVGDAAIAESAPMGAAQGGIRDWFQRLFGRKKNKPVFVDHEDVMKEENRGAANVASVADLNENWIPYDEGSDRVYHMTDENDSDAQSSKGGIKNWFKRHFGRKAKPKPVNEGRVVHIEQPTMGDYYLEGDDETRFMSNESRAIYRIAKTLPQQNLRSDSKMRKIISDDYKKSMSKRLHYHRYHFTQAKTQRGRVQEVKENILRGDMAGERKTFDLLMRANLPENLISELVEMQQNNAAADELLSHISESVNSDDNLKELLEVDKKAIWSAFYDVQNENDSATSKVVMENLIYNAIIPELKQRREDAKNAYVEENGAGLDLSPVGKGILESEAYRNGVGSGEKGVMEAILQAMQDTNEPSENKQQMLGLLKTAPTDNSDNPFRNGYGGFQAPAVDTLQFLSEENRALYEKVQGMTKEEMDADADLRDEVLNQYVTSMKTRMKNMSGENSYLTFATIFNSRKTGEVQTLHKMVDLLLPNGLSRGLAAMANTSNVIATEDGIMLDSHSAGNHALETIGNEIQSNPALLQVLRGALLDGVEERNQSELLMRNLFEKHIFKQIDEGIRFEQNLEGAGNNRILGKIVKNFVDGESILSNALNRVSSGRPGEEKTKAEILFELLLNNEEEEEI